MSPSSLQLHLPPFLILWFFLSLSTTLSLSLSFPFFSCSHFFSRHLFHSSRERGREVYCSVLQCVAVCGSVLQCVAVCCNMLQCVAACVTECAVEDAHFILCCCVLKSVLQCGAVWCSVLQCVAVCGSVLQCVSSVCCSVCCICVSGPP